MRMGHLHVRGILVAAVLLALPWVGPTAHAASSKTKGKGKQITASFTIYEDVICPSGPEVRQTYFSVLSFENFVQTGGTTTSTLQTVVAVNVFDPCTFTFPFDFQTFYGGDLPMTLLRNATVAGHYVFDSGRVVDLNLTLTGTDSIESGNSMQRTNFGHTMVIIRNSGTTRTAAITGTVTIDGKVITTAQMADADANLSRTTSSDITILGHQ